MEAKFQALRRYLRLARTIAEELKQAKVRRGPALHYWRTLSFGFHPLTKVRRRRVFESCRPKLELEKKFAGTSTLLREHKMFKTCGRKFPSALGNGTECIGGCGIFIYALHQEELKQVGVEGSKKTCADHLHWCNFNFRHSLTIAERE